jgi:hypothetical protein
VTSAVTSCATKRIRPGAAPWRSYTVSPDLPLEPGASCGQRFCRNVFVDMDCLCMLSQIVEPRKASRAVALEGPLAGVLTEES